MPPTPPPAAEPTVTQPLSATPDPCSVAAAEPSPPPPPPPAAAAPSATLAAPLSEAAPPPPPAAWLLGPRNGSTPPGMTAASASLSTPASATFEQLQPPPWQQAAAGWVASPPAGLPAPPEALAPYGQLEALLSGGASSPEAEEDDEDSLGSLLAGMGVAAAQAGVGTGGPDWQAEPLGDGGSSSAWAAVNAGSAPWRPAPAPPQQLLANVAPAPGAAAAPVPGAAAAPAPGAAAAPAATPGLANEAGEYNCFLNVIIQCLWHCADFRAAMLAWPAEVVGAHPVVGALHELLLAVQAAEQGGSDGGGRSVVNPTRLREALSALPGQQFKVGEMNDAGEVLLTLYERVREACEGAGLPSAPDTIFGLEVSEAVRCSCGVTSHQHSYTQFFFNVAATALRKQAARAAKLRRRGQLAPRTMGSVLRSIEDGVLKSCDTDVEGCGKQQPVQLTLHRIPRVFTVQLAWESSREGPADILATMQQVHPQVDLRDVYGGEPACQRYRLRCMACYYGSHYQALVLVPLPDGARWLLFDDAAVSLVGGWNQVVARCEAGRIQPSVLFYERGAP